MRRLTILLVVGSALLFAGPASGVVVLWQLANTTIYLGEPFWSLEFENPLAGTEVIKGYAVLDWRDADYAAGPPPWYDDWSVNNAIIDGNVNEIWMRQNGNSIWTTTTVASRVVSIHMTGDDNDGIAKIYVDGTHVATLDMYTAAAPQTVLVIVKNLTKIQHQIRVDDNGVSQQTGAPTDADDVATLGAAALEKKFKWNQPPDPVVPGNVYYGWNEKSVYEENPGTDDQIVADDWVCDTPDPITDIHWWGSHIGWRSGQDPPVVPSSFHITIWTDVPQGPSEPFSRPGQVVWEIDCRSFTCVFDGWDYDPRTGTYEACFYYEQLLSTAEWFYQELEEGIYWISIAAKYPAGATVDYPWGWKTRPRDPNSAAPDDAVRIFNPTAPHFGDPYVSGEAIWWPTDQDSWDMAFELTSQREVPGIKFGQQPDTTKPGLHAHDSSTQTITLADDWVCPGGDVTDLHWYGNYELDAAQQEIRGSEIKHFHISIHLNDTQTCLPIDLPAAPPAWSANVTVTETDTGLRNSENCKIYKYEYVLMDPFVQTRDEHYWFDVGAISNDVTNPPHWRWQHGALTPPGPYCGAAQKLEPPTPGPWTRIGGGTDDQIMAFEVTSGSTMETYVKWSQPPKRYQPDDGFNGWNEFSVYNSDHQIVADDWLCETDDPVTDVHWWASFIGWGDKDPPQLPDKFHLGIWTDGICTWPTGGTFSCPVELIWENYCDSYTWRFVGWDWDPRDVTAGPEACFLFEQDLPQDEWFWQEPDQHSVYWLSIAAIYETGTEPQYPFGVKTRPRVFNDDAVRIFDPTNPYLPDNSLYVNGEPIYWPDVENSWDLAFRLTTKEVICPEKYQLEFSLDIGSDTELSDPYVDGDEGFDPGDVYLGGPYHVYGPWYRPVTPPTQPGGRDGFKDDATIIFPNPPATGDPPPDPPDLAVPPATAVPVGNGLGVAQYGDYFDLDGHDQLSFSLEDYLCPWEQTEGPCIFEAKYLYISYDDDQATGWPQGLPLQADVPVIVPSPSSVSSYGEEPTWDELLGLTVAPGIVYPYVVVAGPMGIADEKAVHPDLKPDPTLLEKDDDDVDSLDITEYDETQDPYGDPDQLTCPYWFFSADHEAHMGLDPGAIYQVDRRVPGVAPIKVVDDDNSLGLPNLGLPESTDVDAFEFVWAPYFTSGFNALAVLFSVDEDDPLTSVDESGGRDPTSIYISFMNGSHNAFLAYLGDDIDALSNWCDGFMIPDTEPPAIETAESCKTHGTVGEFCINILDRKGDDDIEGRWDGPANPSQRGVTKLVVGFDEDIAGVGGLDPSDVSLAPAGTVNNVSLSAANELTILMSSTTDGVATFVSFPGICQAGDASLIVTDTVCIRQLLGTVRTDGSINAADRVDVRNQVGLPVTASNFRADVRADGVINAADRVDVRNVIGNGYGVLPYLPEECPGNG